MKIRITKPGEWYKNLVNEEFNVDVVTRFIGTNYEVRNFREVYKKLNGKYPEDNEQGDLMGLAIHIDHAEILEASPQELDMVKNRRPDPLERWFRT